jgi:hypothetical protein
MTKESPSSFLSLLNEFNSIAYVKFKIAPQEIFLSKKIKVELAINILIIVKQIMFSKNLHTPVPSF